MLKSINPQFKNYQGDVLTQAVIVVEYVDIPKQELKKSILTIKRSAQESYEETESAATESEVVFSEVMYAAKYWLSLEKFQQGNRGYTLEGEIGEIEFTIEMTAEWQEVFDSITGTDTQKFIKLCELHLEQEVLPALRA